MVINFFELFNLPQKFDTNLTELETAYRAIQSASHPDRFVTASTADKIQSMQTATLANEAYLTLKSPGLRGSYLLGLQGITAVDEKNNQMPADFLMQQIEWRENIEDAENAHDMTALENLLNSIGNESKNLQNILSKHFKNNALTEATEYTRKLIFVDKVRADIMKSIEKLEI